ncbi:MAG: hypothetical protein HYX60_06215 [Legionella longbeachae]|nr:hypothetical protein [Legionella longbeachae]
MGVICKHLRTIELIGNQYEHFLIESEQLTIPEGEIKLIAKFFEENSTFFRAPFYRSNVFYDFIAKDSAKELRQINASFKDKLGEKLKTEYKQIMSSPKPFFNEDNRTEFQIFLQKNHEIAIFLLRKLHRLEFFSKRYQLFLKNLPDKKRPAESISSLEPYISPRSPAEASEEEEKESPHRIMRLLATFEEFISSPTEDCSLLPIEVMSLSLQLKNIRNLYQQSTKKETFIETITCICNNSDENSNQFKKQAEELLDLIENLRSLIIAVCESSIDYSVFIWRNSDDLEIFFTFLIIAESVKEAYKKFLADFASLAEKENAKEDCQKLTDKKQEFKEFLYRYPSIAIFIFENLSALKSWSDSYRDWKNNFIYQQKFLISNFFYDDSCLVFFLNLCRSYTEATSEKTENKSGKASTPCVQVFQNFTEKHTDAFNHLQSSILHQSSLKKIREELYKFLAANPAVVDFWFQQFTKFFTSAASLIARDKHLLFQEAKRRKNNSHQLTLPVPSPPAL